ncbi:MAG: iron-only hydrogenase system regulator [Lachnospiraceae bacterium]|jgi:putative iron-only hydrogenase system regulator|nr:iron-only hydrogenase system regulator [Lachnospiraceae bacterium]
MEKRVTVVSIIVKESTAVEEVNKLLHLYRDYVVGRQGIPYKERGVSIISVVLDAPGDVTSALSGKLGMINGVAAKTLTAN